MSRLNYCLFLLKLSCTLKNNSYKNKKYFLGIGKNKNLNKAIESSLKCMGDNHKILLCNDHYVNELVNPSEFQVVSNDVFPKEHTDEGQYLINEILRKIIQ